MSRLMRKTWVLSSVETSPGAGDGTVTGHLVIDPTFEIDRDLVPRNLVRNYLGGSDQLVGTRRSIIKFKTELAGAGTAGDAPAWGKLLRCCGFSQTLVTTGSFKRAYYTPVSGSFETGAFRFIRDGVRYFSKGAVGTVALDMTSYQIPMLDWTFWGFDTAAAEVDDPTPSYSAYQRPLVITDANSGDIRLGGTFENGNIADGTVYKSRGLTLDVGNKLAHVKLLGGESIDITDREVTGEFTVDMTEAAEVQWRTDINDHVYTTMGFSIGTAAGQKVRVWAPNVQRVNPQAVDYEGRVLIKSELRLLPSSGNDELVIVVA